MPTNTTWAAGAARWRRVSSTGWMHRRAAVGWTWAAAPAHSALPSSSGARLPASPVSSRPRAFWPPRSAGWAGVWRCIPAAPRPSRWRRAVSTWSCRGWCSTSCPMCTRRWQRWCGSQSPARPSQLGPCDGSGAFSTEATGSAGAGDSVTDGRACSATGGGGAVLASFEGAGPCAPPQPTRIVAHTQTWLFGPTFVPLRFGSGGSSEKRCPFTHRCWDPSRRSTRSAGRRPSCRRCGWGARAS